MRHRLTVIAVTLCHSYSSRGCRRGGWLSRKRIQLINGGGQTEWLIPTTLLANLNKTICTANLRKLCLFANILLKCPFLSTRLPFSSFPQATLILDRFHCDYQNPVGGQRMDNFRGHHNQMPPDTTSQTVAIKQCIALPVGGCDATKEENCVRIAWTADALPTSSHGELKISFRYDFVRE